MRFALITEGVSEHKIMRHLIEKYFKGQHLQAIRQIQPQLVSDKQSNAGGWPEVLKYCSRADDLREIFIDSDYLIIQIDTDQSQQKPFSVSHSTTDNKLKTNGELYADVIHKLKSLIAAEILQEYGSKILFAICIHSIECWLLPIYFTNNKKSGERNCIVTLNTELSRRNLKIIPLNNKNGTPAIKAYSKILQEWKNKNDITNTAQHNVAFKSFVECLNNVRQSQD